MSGDIPPLPNTPSWRGAQLKDRDSFSFTFTPRFQKAGKDIDVKIDDKSWMWG
jgi:hypothetical protein